MSDSDIVEVQYVDGTPQDSGNLTLIVKRGRRKRAFTSPDLTIIMEITDRGETFSDKMTLKGSIPTKSYSKFLEMQDLLSPPELTDDEGNVLTDDEGNILYGEIQPSEELFNEMFAIFPDFLIPMIKSSTFEASHDVVDSMDSNLKLALWKLIGSTMKISKQAEDAEKK